MMKRSELSLSSQLVVAAVFAVLTIVALYIFVHFAEPPERKPGGKFVEKYTEAPLTQALTPAGMSARMAEIATASMPAGTRQVGRLSGSPGCEATAGLIEQTFRQAGMSPTDGTLLSQQFSVVVPQTERCDLLGTNGAPLNGVTLYPFEPAGLVPVALPPAGLQGKLVFIDSSQPIDLVGKRIEGNIVVCRGMDASWPALAGLGAKAVIFTEDPASLRAPDAPDGWLNHTTIFETSYPRFVVRGNLEPYADQSVSLHCKVTWQTKRTRNVIGVLHGKPSADEALVITSFYDSNSVIPELAPGGEQAVSLASMLELVKAFAPYRGQLERDVIFIATSGHGQSMEGATRLQEAINDLGKKFTSNFPKHELRIAAQERKLNFARKALDIVNSDAAWRTSNNAAYRTTWMRQPADFRDWFEHGFDIVAGDINLERREEYLQARLAWIRGGRPSFRDDFDILHASNAAKSDEKNRHPLMAAYIAAKADDTKAGNVIAAPFWTTAAQLQDKEDGDLFAKWGYRARLKDHFTQLVQYHQQQVAELRDAVAVNRLFNTYKRTLTLNLELNSGGSTGTKDLSVLMGIPLPGTVVEPQSTDIRNTIAEKVPMQGSSPAFRVSSWGSKDASGSSSDGNIHSASATDIESEVWFNCARLAYTIANKNFLPPKIFTPEDTFTNLNTAAVSEQLPVIGRAMLAMAKGKVTMKSLKVLPPGSVRTFIGTVYTTAGTDSLVPNHPLGQRTFVRPYSISAAGSSAIRGVRLRPILATDPYGNYERRINMDIGSWGGSGYTVDAVQFDADGRVYAVKDTSLASQGIFKNENLLTNTAQLMSPTPIHLSMFRATEVACYQRGNPKTLNAFASFNFLSRLGLQPPNRSHIEANAAAPGIIAYLEPDTEFYIAMMDGSAANPEVQTYRAFMVNVDPNEKIQQGEEEIYGRGYLAADTGNLAFPYFDAAESMLRTNEKRLRLQMRYHMADEQMQEAQKNTRKLLAQAKEERAAGDTMQAVNDAGRSLAYAINLHPVLRTNISNAIVGILWYLWLLVPFVFFFEKLVFGFTDIRKQLLTIGITFVAVFSLLKSFHPAFGMVRSSVMILLGFLILLMVVVVVMMVSGRFSQTIQSIRKREGAVEGADINRGGVVGTAFMLGLNNMRRRKVRTGLTCFTLVMITFMMICFASVSTDLQDVEYKTGRAPSSGLLRRDQNFIPLTDNELANLRQIYGLRYPISVHSWLVGALNPQSLKNADISIDREQIVAGEKANKRARVSADLCMPWNEPQFSGIEKYLKTTRGWFPQPPQTPAEIAAAAASGQAIPNYTILPEEVAKELQITPEMVNSGHPMVTIRGEAYEVLGIIDTLKFGAHVGLDGQSVLPYDLNSVQQLIKSADGASLVPPTIGRLRASQVIITSKLPAAQGGEVQFPVSCAILFPETAGGYRLRSDLPLCDPVTIKEQRLLVSEYLERVGTGAYYAIDKTAYYGFRTRAKSLEGLLQLIIPLLIAAMTVFNTMRGSVYERKDEIYVYNAVGIAPNHVFFMFMAEACVYAVMGAMLGYLLSQITGTVLTALNLTGGLNMDYSSIETIYASLAIVAAVMLSTIVPARTAARLALPSDEASWTIPQMDGEVLRFNLPFTFGAHDRVAVISYFQRWLDANGEGSSGSFFCAKPTLQVEEGEHPDGGREPVPSIETTVWLKPYDLGVSQRVKIALPTDAETHEFIAEITIERLSGTMAAWQRTIMPFLVAMRKQFLNWRAVSDVERAEMFTEAKTLLTQATVDTDREKVHA